MYEVEVKIYVLQDPTDLEFDEIPLTVSFDFNDETYNILKYEVNGYEVNIDHYRKDNPGLTKKIYNAIDHFITNFEGEDSWIVL